MSRTPQVRTVDELSCLIKDAIANSPSLRNVALRGELQNFKRHSSGHVYFTLVGRESRISAVLFRSHAASMIAWPEDGDEVMVTGSVDVYMKGGAYQFYATRLLPIGLGAQSRAKEELRAALEREGLFDIRHKRTLPRYPEKIAVVTSPTGAAVQDILKVSANRAPFVDIVIVPAVVQGVEAPPQVASALAKAGRIQGVACVILARGGGAKDDLSPFDDERIVRAIRGCPIPVVTGIGHQTDMSLADLASDASLPTPSAAAERVFPDANETRQAILHGASRLASSGLRICAWHENRVEKCWEKIRNAASQGVSSREEYLRRAMKDLAQGAKRVTDRNEAALASAAARLDALSPLAVLSRGYVLCLAADGRIAKSISAVSEGDEVDIRFQDGTAGAKILRRHHA